MKGCGNAQTTRMLAQKQPPLKECVTAYWSMCSRADNVGGLKPATEARDAFLRDRMVGECSVRGEAAGASPGGAHGSKDAGISSEKTGENPVRRKSKVS